MRLAVILATAAATFFLSAASEPPAQSVGQQCSAWRTAVSEEEGGTAMTASVCSPNAGGTAGTLLVQCGGGNLAVRYLPGFSGEAPQIEPGFETDATFSDGTATLTLHLIYEAMDGALTVSVPPGDPLIALLESGKTVTVAPAGGALKPETFTLSASRNALSVLKAACN